MLQTTKYMDLRYTNKRRFWLKMHGIQDSFERLKKVRMVML